MLTISPAPFQVLAVLGNSGVVDEDLHAGAVINVPVGAGVFFVDRLDQPRGGQQAFGQMLGLDLSHIGIRRTPPDSVSKRSVDASEQIPRRSAIGQLVPLAPGVGQFQNGPKTPLEIESPIRLPTDQAQLLNCVSRALIGCLYCDAVHVATCFDVDVVEVSAGLTD